MSAEIPYLHVIKDKPFLVAGMQPVHFGESIPPMLTPWDKQFVRENAPRVETSPADWRLTTTGKFDNSGIFNLATLKNMGEVTSQLVVKQCAGDNRSALPQPWSGEAWGAEAFGAFKATGVLLKDVFEKTRPQGEYLIFKGADGYARRLTDKQVQDPRLMLAWEMNDEELPSLHGGPVMLVAPGWYGMQWVKNVAEIESSDEKGHYKYNDEKYTIIKPGMTEKSEDVTAMEVNSRIINMADGDKIPPGSHLIHGRAWGGSLPYIHGEERLVNSVEVSLNGGKVWDKAQITSELIPNFWSSWIYPLETDGRSGEMVIMSRATDTAGNTQPSTPEEIFKLRNTGGYRNNATVPVSVTLLG